MDVILHRSRDEQFTSAPPDDATDISMQIIPPFIGDPLGPVFRGKNKMHEDVCERLRHFQLIEDRRPSINPGIERVTRNPCAPLGRGIIFGRATRLPVGHPFQGSLRSPFAFTVSPFGTWILERQRRVR